MEEPLKTVMDKKQDPKELLKQGLQEMGLDPNAPIALSYLDYGTDATSKMWQEWFKQQWETKLGVTINMNIVVDFAQYLEASDRMEFDICTGGWAGDFNDPETFFNLFTTGNSNNPGKWASKEYDDLYAKTKATNDNAERLELFKQMEKLLVEDQAAISPYCYGDVKAFRHTYVKGVQYTMFGSIDYKYAYTQGRQ
jgi:oligopeptide transport system substrate-binding protein